ncbi:MAG: hypothetical protein QGH60_16790 [Phycisphaerae bacterium]|nr:hypothetical protein [Phycisphaerae bacterium]
MGISLWNQYAEHKEIVSLSPEGAHEALLKHYKQSSKSFTLDKENFPRGFSFHRGNVLVSALGLGSELWCKHYVDVDIEELDKEKTQILWNINMKLFGLQAGQNAIVEECKEVVKQIA